MATWATCPEAVRTQVQNFTNALAHILNENLIGIYLHGSLALGGFNPQRSDIDLLIVVRTSLTPDTKREIARLVLRTSRKPHPLELSILREGDLHPWKYPTTFDFHFGEDGRATLQQDMDAGGYQNWTETHPGDPDLAGHITITHHCGICLVGKPIADVFPPVPRADYLASVLNDVLDAPDYIHTNPVYWILNPCRVYWYLLEGRICSKEEAGAWAVDFLPEPYREVVRKALQTYRGALIDPTFHMDELRQYATFITGKIKDIHSSEAGVVN